MADETVIQKAPAEKTHWVRQFVDRARGSVDKPPEASVMSYMSETGSMLGDLAQSGVLGALLGAAHAKWGLDTPAGPVDGIVMGLGSVLSVALSKVSPAAAAVARKAGTSSAAILLFRKGYEVVKHQPLQGAVAPVGAASSATPLRPAPGTGPGVHGEDPIEAVAKGLS